MFLQYCEPTFNYGPVSLCLNANKSSPHLKEYRHEHCLLHALSFTLKFDEIEIILCCQRLIS